MKKLSIAAILAIGSGCAFNRTTENTFNPETNSQDRTTYVGFSFFNKTAVTALKVGARTKTGSTTLSLGEGSTETQSESIKSAGEALGAGIAAGVKKSIAP